MSDQNATPIYVGFWIRFWASVIDSILVSLIITPLLIAAFGWDYFTSSRLIGYGPLDFIISWGLPTLAIVLFWVYKSTSPGKMFFSARIVDAKTGRDPSARQCVVRYLGYFVSAVPLGLGFIWVAFDRRKQGWHDKLAGTIVVRSKKSETRDVNRSGVFT
jgi:uncharacterized RDD family membrane protein YckC